MKIWNWGDSTVCLYRLETKSHASQISIVMLQAKGFSIVSVPLRITLFLEENDVILEARMVFTQM